MALWNGNRFEWVPWGMKVKWPAMWIADWVRAATGVAIWEKNLQMQQVYDEIREIRSDFGKYSFEYRSKFPDVFFSGKDPKLHNMTESILWLYEKSRRSSYRTGVPQTKGWGYRSLSSEVTQFKTDTQKLTLHCLAFLKEYKKILREAVWEFEGANEGIKEKVLDSEIALFCAKVQVLTLEVARLNLTLDSLKN